MSRQQRAYRFALACICGSAFWIGATDLADGQPTSGSPGRSNAATDGATFTDNVVLTADGETWTALDSVVVTTPRRQNLYCMVVASVDVVNPGTCGDPVPAGLVYVFTLTLDALNPAANGGAERTVEFVNTNCPVGADARAKEVTTTNFFQVPPGSHFIYLLGRPQGDVSAAVDDASMSVVCTEQRLP